MFNYLKKHGIFISHSSNNKRIAEQLCAYISAIGVKKRHIFCSSIVGQGVDNGEKLNKRIANSIAKSKVLIFLISNDFLNSPYCIEELGVGWYLAENTAHKSYFLILPDVFSISEIHGFVNSKIDKFSFLDRPEDLKLFAVNLCNELKLHTPSDSSLANAERIFSSAAEPMFKEIIEKRNHLNQEIADKKTEVERLKYENSQIRKEANSLNNTLESERRQYRLNLLEKEYHTIESDFNHFGGQTGITKQKYVAEGESFWFSMVTRYLNIRKKLSELGCPRLYHENIEILIATIYSAHGDLEDAYEFIKSFFLHVRSTIYPNVFDNIVFDDANDTHELIEIIKCKIDNTEAGVFQDSYKQSLEYLLARKVRLEKGDS